jgi:hypothetical protein
LGFVAHEVRNPLSTALWTAELLSRLAPEERGGERGARLAAISLRSLKRLRVLVEDFFLLERLDAGGLCIAAEPIFLEAALSTAATKAGVEIPNLSRLEGLALLGDRILLDRLLDGLISAAGRDGTGVAVTARREGPLLLLELRGAPPAADAMVDPRRGSASDANGRALSLPSARRAARAMGGSLRVMAGAYLLMLPAARTAEARAEGFRPSVP